MCCLFLIITVNKIVTVNLMTKIYKNHNYVISISIFFWYIIYIIYTYKYLKIIVKAKEFGGTRLNN